MTAHVHNYVKREFRDNPMMIVITICGILLVIAATMGICLWCSENLLCCRRDRNAQDDLEAQRPSTPMASTPARGSVGAGQSIRYAPQGSPQSISSTSTRVSDFDKVSSPTIAESPYSPDDTRAERIVLPAAPPLALKSILKRDSTTAYRAYNRDAGDQV